VVAGSMHKVVADLDERIGIRGRVLHEGGAGRDAAVEAPRVWLTGEW
jgi:hypothetical protein